MCEKTLNALRRASERATEWADVIEFRLDCLEPEDLSTGISQLLNTTSRPVILTFRPSEQGGHRNLTREAREAFWKREAPRGEAVWWDLEADLAQDVSPDWSHTIISHHDFTGVPANLEVIYQRLAQTPAHV